MIKILLISQDKSILKISDQEISKQENQLITFFSSPDQLDIITNICKVNPAILIFDDDLLTPSSMHLLKSIKNIKPKLSILFVTSNTSLELGREVNFIGVDYYLMKPFSGKELIEYINTAINQLIKK